MENNIGEARRNYQSKNGKFTQGDAAKFFGVSLSTYKKWEQGQGMMNGEQLREIAMKYIKAQKNSPRRRSSEGNNQRQNFLAKDTQPMITLLPAVWCPNTRDCEHRDDRDDAE